MPLLTSLPPMSTENLEPPTMEIGLHPRLASLSGHAVDLQENGSAMLRTESTLQQEVAKLQELAAEHRLLLHVVGRVSNSTVRIQGDVVQVMNLYKDTRGVGIVAFPYESKAG